MWMKSGVIHKWVFNMCVKGSIPYVTMNSSLTIPVCHTSRHDHLLPISHGKLLPTCKYLCTHPWYYFISLCVSCWVGNVEFSKRNSNFLCVILDSAFDSCETVNYKNLLKSRYTYQMKNISKWIINA